MSEETKNETKNEQPAGNETPEFSTGEDPIKPAPPEMIRPDLTIKHSDQFGGLDLSEKTVKELEKQGVELDGTHTLQGSPEKSPDKKGKDDKGGKEADESQEGQPKKSAEAEKETEGDSEKTGDLDKLDFTGKVNQKISSFTEGEQEQFLSDLDNWTKYTKSNTEKAMKLADREKELGDLELLKTFSQSVTSEDIKEALQL